MIDQIAYKIKTNLKIEDDSLYCIEFVNNYLHHLN